MTAVMHPELFGAFVALDGQLGPNTGTQRQTIARLFGGDEQAWAAFDPKTVIEKRGRYDDMAAWLGVSDDIPAEYRAAGDTAPAPDEIARLESVLRRARRQRRANCAPAAPVTTSNAPWSDTAVRTTSLPREQAFATALPWLAGRLGTPDVPARSRCPVVKRWSSESAWGSALVLAARFIVWNNST